MTKNGQRAIGVDGETRYQQRLLPGVSRTFALTIPQLPRPLRAVVTNAYLLCRIADTVEDDVGIDTGEKRTFHEMFIETLNARVPAGDFVQAITPLLSPDILPAERELIEHADTVVGTTFTFAPRTQEILKRHVETMCRGMPAFQHLHKRHGLRDLDALEHYCYYVAGVVGEMLTELFCDYSQQIANRREELHRLSASFGQGLQMTNILKDVWDDRESGVCWLPRDVFEGVGYDLSRLAPSYRREAFARGIDILIGIAHAHLRNALEYTLLIPAEERGVRRFCLWSLGLAVLTLRRIHANRSYVSGQEVKVSRTTVRLTTLITDAVMHSDLLLRSLFALCARGLPLSETATRSAPPSGRERRQYEQTAVDTRRANA